MTRPSFRVWRPESGVRYWAWRCTLCDPPVDGGRRGTDAWARIIGTSLPHHMNRRRQHHAYVARRRGIANKQYQG